MGPTPGPAGSGPRPLPHQLDRCPASLAQTHTQRAAPGAGLAPAAQAPGGSDPHVAGLAASPHSQCAAAGISYGKKGGGLE